MDTYHASDCGFEYGEKCSCKEKENVMSMSEKMSITTQQLKIIAAYNKANNQPTWVIYSDPAINSKYNGVSSRFIKFNEDETVQLQDASGRYYSVSFETVTIRVQF